MLATALKKATGGFDPGQLRVQRGDVSTDGLTVDVTIDPVNLDHAFADATARATGATNGGTGMISFTADLINATTLRLTRGQALFSNTVIVEWQVVENPAWLVQKVATTVSGGSTTESISPVDPEQSFVICNGHAFGAGTSGFLAGRFVDGETLEIYRQSTSGSGAALAYVVEVPGAVVQRGDTSISGTSTNVTISAVDRSRSFAIGIPNGSSEDGDDPGTAPNYTTTNLSSDTNLAIQRGNSTGSCSTSWQVVQLPVAVVQRADVSTSATSDVASIDPVDMERCFVVHTQRNSQFGFDPGRQRASAQITDADEVTYARQASDGTLITVGYVVEV